MKRFFSLFAFGFISITILAQTSVNLEIRPRTEYGNGFGTPQSEGADAGLFTSQRSRLSVKSTVQKVDVKISVQDIRVFGQAAQLSGADGLFSLHEGYLKFSLDSNGRHSIKVGRQELAYDDERLFGAVAWAQQARRHDMLLYKYQRDSGAFKFDFGIGFNQVGPNYNWANYPVTTPFDYKSIQLIRVFKQWDKNISSSFIGANIGFEQVETNDHDIIYSQTFGTHTKFIKGNLSGYFNGFYQTGRITNGSSPTPLNAFLVGAGLNYKVKSTTLGAGYEMQSGADMNATNGESTSFNPFFGTNHKFNGLMDYFFVGNHFRNVGLSDVHVSVKQRLGEKSFFKLAGHSFSGTAVITDGGGNEVDDKRLGEEIDLVVGYKLNGNVKIVAGYSRFFTKNTINYIKGTSNLARDQDWAWIMIVGKINKFFK